MYERLQNETQKNLELQDLFFNYSSTLKATTNFKNALNENERVGSSQTYSSTYKVDKCTKDSKTKPKRILNLKTCSLIVRDYV